MPLSAFRQIFIWPLVAAPVEDLPEKIQRLGKEIESPWRPVPDPLRHLEAERDGLSAEAYQEFVYFHGFVQHFLFDKNSPALRLFQRSDIGKLDVCLQSSEETIRLQVDRVHLYLFDIGVSTLVVEVSSESLRLADALNLGECARRVYPAFWNKHGDPGLYPHRMTWCDKQGMAVVDGAAEEQTCFISHVQKKRRAPVAEHWRQLLPGSLKLDGYETGDLRWRQVVDERMPTMVFIITDQIDDISRGDWVRLCFVDGAGTKVLPYAEPFLQDFEEKHAYDRFWGDCSPKSRILISGYGFAMACDASEFSWNVLETNFRRHYFQMGLALHFQMAALLSISSGLSQAVANYENSGLGAGSSDERSGRLFECTKEIFSRRDPSEKKFKERIDELRKVLLQFTHCYWFTGLSNHVQGRELYDLWRGRLGLKAIYDEIRAEAQETDEYLRAKSEEDNTKANTRLMQFATVSLPPALAIGFLGINVIVGEENGWTDLDSWATVIAVVAAFCMLGAVLGCLMKKGRNAICILICIGILAAIIALGLCFL